MTPKREDYLKIIFELGGKKKKIPNKQSAWSVNVAAGSGTETVQKLCASHLVENERYEGN